MESVPYQNAFLCVLGVAMCSCKTIYKSLPKV